MCHSMQKETGVYARIEFLFEFYIVDQKCICWSVSLIGGWVGGWMGGWGSRFGSLDLGMGNHGEHT